MTPAYCDRLPNGNEPMQQGVQELLNCLEKTLGQAAVDVARLGLSNAILRPTSIQDTRIFMNCDLCADPKAIMSKYRYRGEVAWCDIRERRGTDDPAKVQRHYRAVDPAVLEVVSRLWFACAYRVLDSTCGHFAGEDIVEDIVSDFLDFIIVRGVAGRADASNEHWIALYESGVMPAGWNGDFPSGQMVLLYRPR